MVCFICKLNLRILQQIKSIFHTLQSDKFRVCHIYSPVIICLCILKVLPNLLGVTFDFSLSMHYVCSDACHSVLFVQFTESA